MNIVRPLICVVLCMTLGFLSGLSSFDAINTWYATLVKPSFNPPNWLFGPVWSILYIMIGVAVGLVWNLGLDKPGVKAALVAFTIQFSINLAWTPVFFGMQQLLAGLVIIVVMWVAILGCMMKFFKLRKLSGWLLLPYWLWVSFATVLNGSLWWLNK